MTVIEILYKKILRNRNKSMVSKYLHRLRVVLPHILLYSATVIYSISGAIVFHKLELPFEIGQLKYHSLNIANAQVCFSFKNNIY